MESLKETYGNVLTDVELSEFLGIDPRTVKKYADIWGGVEVSPGKFRFYEKVIRRRLDANIDNEAWQKALEGSCRPKWKKKRKAVSRPDNRVQEKCNIMGNGGKEKTGKRVDRHGLFDNP